MTFVLKDVCVCADAPETTPVVCFSTLDCEAPENGLTPSRPFPFEANYALGVTNVTSFGGLVCIRLYNYDYYDDYFIVLWNPLTGEYKKLSNNNSFHQDCRAYGTYCREEAYWLYYSSSDDDYKLLHVNGDEAHAYIYSLKSDTWRKLHKLVNSWISEGWGSSILLNGKLYFLGKIWKIGERRPSCWVTEFDTETEKFTEIATPSYGKGFIVALKGCIHYYMTSQKGNFDVFVVELWRMDGNGDWTKLFVRHCNEPSLLRSLYPYEPLHIMRNGDWLIHDSWNSLDYSLSYIYQVDMENHTQDKVYTPYCMAEFTAGKYIETLVSPNRYNKQYKYTTPPT